MNETNLSIKIYIYVELIVFFAFFKSYTFWQIAQINPYNLLFNFYIN